MAELSAMLSTVEAQLQQEIALMDAQIRASRRARGVPEEDSAADSSSFAVSAEELEAQEMVKNFIEMINRASDAFNTELAASSATVGAANVAASEAIEALKESESQLPKSGGGGGGPSSAPVSAEALAPSPSDEQQQQQGEQSAVAAPPSAPSPSPSPTTTSAPVGVMKGGMLYNYGKERFMRSFTNTYLVVSDGVTPGTVAGVAWYDSEASFKKGSSPIDSIPFFITEKNSRGSLFKKASVCWPLVTEEDCPKLASLSAADKQKTYFALDYVNPKSGKTDLVVLGASSAAERDEWVTFITKFLVLYLPPGEEFEPFINFPVGANPPLHVSMVLGGEAPGSAQRVIDPTRR